ncbi:Pcl5p SKDI_08G1150 [Saccharomyces kudriavzevii IFO 1802]|uniref:Uncharacterized protein n=2 Tax=Saccharomyces kudriavzevii (strain ATCC MYA-4449 / AS 2.2408 / CBS 8840 / NBRC 1802 / NCYC 2889) TaxID=226230 RepID=A0AA35JL57_SACK1|nr:uncharacterized protein SKDI_08G1150 [Saccharomyces kudriavzevii IFO 1802]EJT42388.1 PCL5-like protein [Saccharomyces kudriavzevii IFO 1802]CAI4063682.1 hypothetical protein SKDI_08G1150 [Saccharomyces kudriavzevii IFO 1802]
MYGNHRFTPDSREFDAGAKSKDFSTSNNPYQTPPSETNSTYPQTNSIKRKTNLALTISAFLSDISRPLSNGKINNSPQNILKFLNEVFKRSKCSKENAILATFYFQRIYRSRAQNESSLPEFSRCSKRIFLCCLILSHKFLNDNTYSMKNWQIISGLHAKDLSLMERWCLGKLNYELAIPCSDLLLWETNTLMKRASMAKRPGDADHDFDAHPRKLIKSC